MSWGKEKVMIVQFLVVIPAILGNELDLLDDSIYSTRLLDLLDDELLSRRGFLEFTLRLLESDRS